eukprot:TRINITY_DN125111_c0_g1_i1.p1 TRINITY_DN125111_c0_g1~~TRINITY_DN125111_c0_g1_i1.p1  ORF type:complete len:355 (+),score=52.08 TRINITY_DN125111_c0_g1_i1:130-1194(+)
MVAFVLPASDGLGANALGTSDSAAALVAAPRWNCPSTLTHVGRCFLGGSVCMALLAASAVPGRRKRTSPQTALWRRRRTVRGVVDVSKDAKVEAEEPGQRFGAFVVDNTQLGAKEDGLCYRLTKKLEDIDTTLIAPWGSIVEGYDEGDGWLRVGSSYLPTEIEGKPVLTPCTPKYDYLDDDVVDRFLNPRIDDFTFVFEDMLFSGILAPALSVFLVVLTNKYVPGYLLYEGVRKRAVLLPTLLHGVSLAFYWLLGALAARAYEAEAIDRNYPQETLVRTLKACAFATGCLVVVTVTSVRLSTGEGLAKSPEGDVAFIKATLDILLDTIFEVNVMVAWRLLRSQVGPMRKPDVQS